MLETATLRLKPLLGPRNRAPIHRLIYRLKPHCTRARRLEQTEATASPHHSSCPHDHADQASNITSSAAGTCSQRAGAGAAPLASTQMVGGRLPAIVDGRSSEMRVAAVRAGRDFWCGAFGAPVALREGAPVAATATGSASSSEALAAAGRPLARAAAPEGGGLTCC